MNVVSEACESQCRYCGGAHLSGAHEDIGIASMYCDAAIERLDVTAARMWLRVVLKLARHA